jgi:hypothetical protein
MAMILANTPSFLNLTWASKDELGSGLLLIPRCYLYELLYNGLRTHMHIHIHAVRSTHRVQRSTAMGSKEELVIRLVVDCFFEEVP